MALRTYSLRAPYRTFTRGVATSRYIHLPPRPLPPRTLPLPTLLSRTHRFQPLGSLMQHYNRNITQRRYLNNSAFHASAIRWMVDTKSGVSERSYHSNSSSKPVFWQSLSEFNKDIQTARVDEKSTDKISDTLPPSNTVAAATADLSFPDTAAWEDELADAKSDTPSEEFRDALAYQPSENDTSLSSTPESLLANSWADSDIHNKPETEPYNTAHNSNEFEEEDVLQDIIPTFPPTNMGETLFDDFIACGVEITPSGHHFLSHPKLAGIRATEIDDASIDAVLQALDDIEEEQLAVADPLFGRPNRGRVGMEGGPKKVTPGNEILDLLLEDEIMEWKAWKLIHMLLAHETSLGRYLLGRANLLRGQVWKGDKISYQPARWNFYKVLKRIVKSGWIKVDGGEF
ncbi:hypothetical protein AA313_de0200338 [Arthrobotrys entomopaga]|nr:hypothetical protein AA313_de0200338 [Arthrobotrys entomopaga]